MITWRALALATIAALFGANCAAAESFETALPLPKMERCSSTLHPVLPDKWRGTFLMAPFTKTQIMLGDFLIDSSISAMRVRLFGLRHGSADILVKGRKTYLLQVEGARSGGCQDLGDTGLRPLPRDWLAPGGQCEGSARIGDATLDWWKAPSRSPRSADWFWYKRDDSSPFRVMFTQPAAQFAILGWYTFSYQVRFESLRETDLPNVAALCESKPLHPGEPGNAPLQKIIAGIERSQSRDGTAIAALMPQLEAVCPDTPYPNWPEHGAMSGLMISPDFRDGPVPTEILYDGKQRKMRTRFFSAGPPPRPVDDTLLIDGPGYAVAHLQSGKVCGTSLPGALRPNWLETGGCSCEASLKGTSALTPFGPARIYMCPMTAPRVVWAWFTLEGRPTVFMESSAPDDRPDGVLTLVDYYDWRVAQNIPHAAFDVPAQCSAPGAKNPVPLAIRPGMRCGACHLGALPRG